MSKECLDYDCEMPHHEFDDMNVKLSYSAPSEDVIVEISVPDGSGFSGGGSHISITAAELREIVLTVNQYQSARNVMELGDTRGTDLNDIVED